MAPSHTWQALVESSQQGPLETYRAAVADSWIDYNDHLTEGYYAVAFGNATDAYLAHRGFDAEYRAAEQRTFYTVETHIRYLRELKAGDRLLVRTAVLGVEAKKLHLFHSMINETEGYEAATQESFLLHVATDTLRLAPMADRVLGAIEADRNAHAPLLPEGVGRAVRSLRGTS